MANRKLELMLDRVEVKGEEEHMRPAGLSLFQAFGTRNFWLLLFGWSFSGATVALISTHLVPYATDLGISTIEASTIISVMGAFTILSRVLAGRVSDNVGRKAPGIITALLRAGAFLWLIWSRELWAFYLFAVVFGLSWGGLSLAVTALCADIFTGHRLGLIMAALEGGFSISAAIAPYIGGLIFDTTGSYYLAFIIGTVIMLLTAISMSLIKQEVRSGVD